MSFKYDQVLHLFNLTTIFCRERKFNYVGKKEIRNAEFKTPKRYTNNGRKSNMTKHQARNIKLKTKARVTDITYLFYLSLFIRTIDSCIF